MKINWHSVWLWSWFIIGMATYWLKRAYYLVTGPNPVASTYKQFVQRCWIPLLVRSFFDAIAYWILFIPGMATKVVTYFGYPDYEWAMIMVTNVAPIAALFGHAIDSIMDFAVSKIPFVKDYIPQMPGPLPKPPLPPTSGGN